MCGRYYLQTEDLHPIIAALLHNMRADAAHPFKVSGEIFPGDLAPVIAPNKAREPKAFAMQWGFVMSGSKRLINARSETAAEKPMFRDSMRFRRCLIPASYYFEWGQKDKAKYCFRMESGQGICMAGLYHREADGRYTYTILTRDAHPGIAHVHSRMPIILPQEALLPWLDEKNAPQQLLKLACTDVACTPAEQIVLDKLLLDGLY